MRIRNRFAVGCGGIAMAAAVSLAAAPAASADTINVVQKTRYWSDNSVYYEYGPFSSVDHCYGFQRANPGVGEEFGTVNRAQCWGDVHSGAWYLNAPFNIL